MKTKRIVAIVPIKLHSQRLPNKNTLPIGEHPLCWYIVNSLLSVKDINETFVYCSDEAVKRYIPEKATFLKRDPRLDGDFTKGFEIYQSFIKEVHADIYVLGHTTSPFLKSGTISNALSSVLKNGYDSAFSARRFQTFAWYQGKPINYNPNDVPRTQDIESIFIETSGFYIFRKEVFTEYHRRIGINPYIQEVNDIEAVDIDIKQDYDFALMIANGKPVNGKEIENDA